LLLAYAIRFLSIPSLVFSIPGLAFDFSLDSNKRVLPYIIYYIWAENDALLALENAAIKKGPFILKGLFIF